MLRKNVKIKIVALLFFIVSLQMACTTARYRQPISKFQAASAVVSASARKSYSESNRLNRTLEIKRLTREGKFIIASDLDKVQFFRDEDIKARFDALDRLNDYADLLVSIANSDAPENISKSAQDLTGALSNLTGTLGGLQNADFPNSQFGVKTQNAFGVASVIVSEVLKAFIQKKIKKGLEAAILKGEQPINELIDALSADLTVINDRYISRLKSERVDIQKLYNCEANKERRDPTFTDCKDADAPFNQQVLNGYRDQLIAYADTLETLKAANPTEPLSKMKKAHIKIVTLAKSKSPADFAEAVAAIEDFANAAKRLGDAVDKLRNS